MSKLVCKLILHSKAGHLNQIYTGFLELEKQGYLELIIEKDFNTAKQILEVVINNSIKVIYDTMDEEEFYAVDTMKINDIDYYFKRSYRNENASKYKFRSFPLGLNYNVYSNHGSIFGIQDTIKSKVKKIIRRNKYNFYTRDFESEPIISKIPKICFLTRVWDTEAKEIENEEVREERKKINQFRINCIRACKREFGNQFIGGVEDSDFARKICSDVIIEDKSVTRRDNFLDLVKQCDICIATTGLHNSIGWKFGEYVAASRAIVTEPLYYELPGDIKKEENYLEFLSCSELINNIKELISNDKKRKTIMENNNRYYKTYASPEAIIRNSLDIIKKHN